MVDLPRRENMPHHSSFLLAHITSGLERFKGYRHGPFRHRVALPCHDYGNMICGFFETRLDWIYENVSGDWCVRIMGYREDLNASVNYGFSDARDGVHFALRWSGE